MWILPNPPSRSGMGREARIGSRCSDVRTTMIYTHVLQRGGIGLRSPMDVH
jgi:hypothetical protein